MSSFSVRVFAAGLVFVALAGCADQENPVEELEDATDLDEGLVQAGRDLRADLLATDELGAPLWAVGDWFGHHVFIGAGDEEGFHINTVVIEATATNYNLATDSEEIALFEAIFDIPILGDFAAKDLTTGGFGGTWDLYDFPLTDGKTWTADFPYPDFDDLEPNPIPLTFEAKYNGRIKTPGGDRPGFDITAKTSDGLLVLSYDFLPDINWYAHWFLWDIDTDEPEDYVFHSMSMGHGPAWQGTYYVDTADVVLSNFHGAGVMTPVPPDANEPPEPYASPSPYKAFTVADAATHIYGFIYGFAFGGAQETLLVDPNNEYREVQAVGTPFGEDFVEMLEPAIAGEWKLAMAGAGAATGSFAQVWAVVQSTGTL